MTLMRHFAALLALAAAVTIGAPPAKADDYPSRSVKIIVPFGAGGPTDVYARSIAEELRKSLHQPFIIDNRPGAGTTIGTDLVAKAAPDGYTLLMVSGTQTVNETLYKKKQYQLMRDLVPIAPLIDSDLVLVVHPSVPAKNLAELLALARAKPGTLNFASSGPGSNYHMAAELLKHLTGIDIVHVPYKGSTGMRNRYPERADPDAVRQHSDHGADDQGGQRPRARHQRQDALAEFAGRADDRGSRRPRFPGDSVGRIMAPAGTPQPIVELLNREISKILARPDIKEAWEKTGATPIVMSQPEFKAFMESEVAKWTKIIKANHIPPIN